MVRSPPQIVGKSVEKVEKSPAEEILSEFGLGIFAKQPLPGRVKTRLSPPLSSAEAAEIYRISLEETVRRMGELDTDLHLFYAGDEAYFSGAFPELRRTSQAPGDLGVKMAAALGHLLDSGHLGAALIGSDSPDLPLSLVREALLALKSADFVTVPALDGGYVLVGVRRRVAEMFREIPWSTPRVLPDTRQRARDLGLVYRELKPWEDIDDFASLNRLVQRSPESETARFVRDHLSGHGLRSSG